MCTACPYTKHTNKDNGCLVAAIGVETLLSVTLCDLGVEKTKVTWFLTTEKCDCTRSDRLIHPYIAVDGDVA